MATTMTIQCSKPTELLIEGGHLARGQLACLCAAIAIPGVRLQILQWSQEAFPEPILPGSTVHAVSLAQYYDTLRDLLASRYMLVVPCTQRGIVMANAIRHKSPVLSESWLTDMGLFDKRYLREKFSALRDHFSRVIKHWTDETGPLLAKPLGGNSSSGQALVTNASDFERLSDSGEYLFEVWFGESRLHYSCTLFKGGGWACIERVNQSGGHTSVARKVCDRRVVEFCDVLETSVHVESAINFQFAEVDGSFLIYDINPRFGYSELFRTCWGNNFVSSYFGSLSTTLTDEVELTRDAAWSLLRSSAIAASIRA